MQRDIISLHHLLLLFAQGIKKRKERFAVGLKDSNCNPFPCVNSEGFIISWTQLKLLSNQRTNRMRINIYWIYVLTFERIINLTKYFFLFSQFAGVTVKYVRGLPHVTVPLPSRNEKCQFTLRPVTHNVGDFLEMLKVEDRGIDRAAILSNEGVRIASACSIENLLDENFW